MSERRLDQLESLLGALLERQDKGHSLVTLRERYAADNPLGFDLQRFLVTELGLAFYPKLTSMVAGLVERPYNCWIGAHAMGKTHLAANVAVALAAAGWLVLVTAPREHQLKNGFMPKAFVAWRRAKLPGDFLELGWRPTRGDDAGILAFTSDAVSRFGGYHSPVGTLVILDESQGVAPEAWDGLRGAIMGAGRRRWIALGNPLFAEGRFREVASMPHYHVERLRAADSPNVIEGRTVISGLITAEDVEETARDYGAGSDYYRSRILAEFPSQNERGLINRAWCDAAAERWKATKPPDDRTDTLLSVDPARFGADETAVCVRRGRRVMELVTWRGADLMATVAKLRAIGDQWGVRPRQECGSVYKVIPQQGKIVVDTVGLGAGCYDRLRECGYSVREFNGGSRPTMELPGLPFANLRAQAWWQLAAQLRDGLIDLPPDEKLFNELTQITWRPNPAGKVQLESKDELRERLGRSPDRADAVAQAFIQRNEYTRGGVLV